MKSNIIRIEDYCRNDLERRHRRRILSRLAKTLIHNFRISDGDELVLVLGHGHENDNLEAIISWIEDNMPQIQLQSNHKTLFALTRKLRCCLEDAQEVSNA